jgi:hypothetical protein
MVTGGARVAAVAVVTPPLVVWCHHLQRELKMPVTGTVTIGQQVRAVHRAVPAEGRCSCGWAAASDDKDAETMDHLYGGLRGRAREFAYAGARRG